MKEKKDLIQYVQNQDQLKKVGYFDKWGAFEFNDPETLTKQASMFTPEQIWDLYLTWYDPVLHYKVDKEDLDYIEQAFLSLINMFYT